jgi:MFS family permease
MNSRIPLKETCNLTPVSTSRVCPAIPGFSSRGAQLLLLTLTVWAGIYLRYSVGPLQEAMRIDLGLTDNQMALLQGPALYLPMALLFVPVGLLINRFSRIRLLLTLSVLSIVGSILSALAANFAMLVVGRCLVGLSADAAVVVASSVLADHYAPAQRGRASTVMTLGQTAGVATAFALGGALLAHSDAGLHGWSGALLWMTLPVGVVMLSMLAMREPARSEVAIRDPSTGEAFIELWRHRALVLPLSAAVFMVSIADGAAINWAAPVLSRRFNLAPDHIGAVVAVVLLVSGTVGTIVGGLVADYCQRIGGTRRTMTVLSVLTTLSAPAALFALAPGVASASVLLGIFAAIGGIVAVTAMTVTIIVIPNEVRGLCLGVLTFVSAIPGALAPMTVSLLSAAIGGPAMIGNALTYICVPVSLFGAATIALGSRHFPRTAQ